MANVSAFTGAMPVIPGGTVELGYLPKTSTVPVNAGSGSQVSVVGPLTVVCDGSPIMVEFYCEEAAAATTAGAYLIASLWVDGAETTRTMGVVYAGATGSNHGETLHAVQRITPAAGSHTIEIKGWSSAAGNFYAAAGGTAAYAPMWLRVSKIVNQNDGLKPFWTPPVVTQLPSQATEGDQVLLYSASPYAGYQTHQYVTGSWRTLDDSRGTGAWQSWTPTVAQGATNNIAKTVQYAKYVVLGKTVIANCRLDLTANGTAGSQASISIPSEIATASTNPRVGACHIYDASTTVRYTGQAEFLTSTTLGFVGDWSGNNAWGAAPNLALGTSDQIGFSIMYEIA